MRAVQVSEPGLAELVDASDPRAVDGEVVVAVERAAMCPTDVKLMKRGSNPPRVPGHEIAGRLADGSLVGVHPDIGCGRCAICRAGHENRCPDRVSIGIDRDGGFAERVAVPASHAFALEVDLDVVPLIEPLACCVQAARMLPVRAGQTAMVVGAGAMGLLCMWTLRALGAVVGVCQRSEARRRLVKELGADFVFGPHEAAAQAMGEAPEVAVVTAPGGAALRQALEGVAVGGTVHAFAGSPGGAQIDANTVHYRHLTLVGSTGSTFADYRRAVELVSSGAVPLHRVPTSTVVLEEVPAALRGDVAGDVLKVLIAV
jgi:L-iditol 2-dehydrogenase